MVQDLALVQFSSICLICQNPTKYWGYKNQRQGTSLFSKIYAIPEKKNIPSYTPARTHSISGLKSQDFSPFIECVLAGV